MWSMLFFLPLGLFSFRSSWAILSALTLFVAVLSVPKMQHRVWYWLSVFLVITAYPSLRLIADGNFDVAVLAGGLLILAGYSAMQPFVLGVGLLMITVKIQACWLLLIVLGLFLLRWPIKKVMTLAVFLAIFVIPGLMLYGQPWLNTLNDSPFNQSVMNSSLLVAPIWHGIGTIPVAITWFLVFGLSLYLGLASRQLSREKVSMLMAASLLLAPYSAANSFFALAALSVIRLVQTRPRLGLPLLLLTDLLFLIPTEIKFEWSALFWTLMFGLVWAVNAWQIYVVEIRDRRLIVQASA
jgi:hypothetical protein